MWTSAHMAVLEAYVGKFGLPMVGPDKGTNDDAARGWARGLAEQFCYSFPGEGWGHKSAGGGRPPSTDVIARRSPFVGFDVIKDQGLASQSLVENPGPLSLVGQVFIEVSPVDHVGAGGGSVPGPSVPPSPVVDVAALRAAVRAELEPVAVRLSSLEAAVAEIGPRRSEVLDGIGRVDASVGGLRDRLEGIWGETHKMIGEQVGGILAAITAKR